MPARLAAAVTRRPLLLLTLVLAVAASAAVPASRLRLESRIDALLPHGAPAAEAYRRFLAAFGGIERVFVVVTAGEGANLEPDDLAGAAEALAEELEKDPEVARARWGLTQEDEAFFTDRVAPRMPLLLGDGAAAAVARATTPEALRERARRLREAADSPGSLFIGGLLASDPLGLAESRIARIAGGGALPFDLMTGAFLSRDGDAALVLVTPRRSEVDPEGGRRLEAALDAAFARAREATRLPFRVRAVGGPLYAVHDERALRDDLLRILSGATLLVGGLILLAFDGLAIPAASMFAMLVGQLVTGALVAFSLGSVTAVGVGFAAMLVGLGDDYTIHLGARFRELWLGGGDARTAMRDALVETGPGNVSSAMTTAAAFAVLGFAGFRPLREMGLVVALGVVLLLLATALVAAPFLTLAARRWKPRPPRIAWRGLGVAVEAAVGAGVRRPGVVLALAALATVVCAFAAGSVAIDTDLRAMRPDDHPADAVHEILVRSFGVGLDTSTVTIEARDLPSALDRANRVAALLRQELGRDAEVVSPSDWLVAGERTRARLAELAPLRLGDAADRAERALADEGLNPRAFRVSLDALRVMGRGEDPDPRPLDDLPEWITTSIRQGPDGAAVAVHVRVPLGRWPEGPPPALREAVERAAPGSAFAAVPLLGVELKRLAIHDLVTLGALAVLVVGGIVLVSYRGDLAATLLTFVPVALGAVWTFGIWGALGRKLDLFSLCVLPVLVGIGVDNALHVIHLSRQARGGNLAGSAGAVGRGLVLSTLTTCAGFASLALSHVPGLRNGGMLICLGTFLCLVATFLVLPAAEGWIAARRATRS